MDLIVCWCLIGSIWIYLHHADNVVGIVLLQFSLLQHFQSPEFPDICLPSQSHTSWVSDKFWQVTTAGTLSEHHPTLVMPLQHFKSITFSFGRPTTQQMIQFTQHRKTEKLKKKKKQKQRRNCQPTKKNQPTKKESNNGAIARTKQQQKNTTTILWHHRPTTTIYQSPKQSLHQTVNHFLNYEHQQIG